MPTISNFKVIKLLISRLLLELALYLGLFNSLLIIICFIPLIYFILKLNSYIYIS
jgi:hypothetical protein